MRKRIESFIAIAVMLGFFFFGCTLLMMPPLAHVDLFERGRKANAIFYEVSPGGEGPATCLYGFYVDHYPFEGHYTCEKFNYELGDTLQIVYLVNDPNINALKEQVESPFIKNFSALLNKSKLLHHALFEKDTI
ncbi:MAG: hypothetical protein KA149_08345 [Chitinophagales bacterium]|nr:hypothetical protein [Chitinophagales bacterium]